jgi:uncharacterized membrane protein
MTYLIVGLKRMLRYCLAFGLFTLARENHREKFKALQKPIQKALVSSILIVLLVLCCFL